MPARISGPFASVSARRVAATSPRSSPSPAASPCSSTSSIANWCDGSPDPSPSIRRSVPAPTFCPCWSIWRRLRSIRSMKAPPGRSGSTFCHVSTASTKGLPARRASPSLRSPAVFIAFSSNWKDNSSSESWNSCAGSPITWSVKPIAVPDSATAWFVCCVENASFCRASKRPAESAWRMIWAASIIRRASSVLPLRASCALPRAPSAPRRSAKVSPPRARRA